MPIDMVAPTTKHTFENWAMINPMAIDFWFAAMDEDGIDTGKTHVHFRTGGQIIVLLDADTFERTLDEVVK